MSQKQVYSRFQASSLQQPTYRFAQRKTLLGCWVTVSKCRGGSLHRTQKARSLQEAVPVCRKNVVESIPRFRPLQNTLAFSGEMSNKSLTLIEVAVSILWRSPWTAKVKRRRVTSAALQQLPSNASPQGDRDPDVPSPQPVDASSS